MWEWGFWRYLVPEPLPLLESGPTCGSVSSKTCITMGARSLLEGFLNAAAEIREHLPSYLSAHSMQDQALWEACQRCQR